jgi:hypothetical protein
MFYSTTISLLLLPFVTQAFEVAFYTGSQCRAERLSVVDISLEDGCQDHDGLNSRASSACISRGADEPLTQSVAFYEGDSCDINDGLIASANSGYVNVGAGFQNFASFRVIDGPSRRLASLATRSERTGIKHGDFFESAGEIWRWEQIARDAFRGIRPDDWILANRIIDDEPLDSGIDYPFNFTKHDEVHGKPAYILELEAKAANETGRSLNPAHVFRRQNDGLNPTCGIFRTCANHLGFAIDYYFPNEARWVANRLEAARERATLENMWTFLGQPLVLPFGVGVATGFIGARYFGEDPSGCQQDPNEAELILELAMSEGLLSADKVQALRSTVREGNPELGDIAVALWESEDDESTNGCGAPSGEVTHSLSFSRVKRAMLEEIPGLQAWLEERAMELELKD